MANPRIFQLAPPQLGEDEKRAVSHVIDSGWITQGDRVAAFEAQFAGHHGTDSAVAVSSCTAALHLALAALGIGPGDEVLVPTLTFVATSNAVLYAGARPVFVDVEDARTPHISLADAAAKCTERTRAAIVMHYGGYPVDMPAWRRFADEHEIGLIEDAAHSPGIADGGKYSDMAAFSVFGNKNMTTAEGGMLISRDSDLTQALRLMRSHGMTSGTLDRDRGHAYSYDVVMLGYNYRMDELRAALGIEQLRRLPEWNENRRRATITYREQLESLLPQVTIPFETVEPSACHIMPIVLPDDADRGHVMETLRDHGIQSSIHYPVVHGFSYYRQLLGEQRLPASEAFSDRELTLPLHASLSDDDIRTIVRALKTALAGA
jgi:dTDP-4-amino-4,6-dideoxygalactose transaminase